MLCRTCRLARSGRATNATAPVELQSRLPRPREHLHPCIAQVLPVHGMAVSGRVVNDLDACTLRLTHACQPWERSCTRRIRWAEKCRAREGSVDDHNHAATKWGLAQKVSDSPHWTVSTLLSTMHLTRANSGCVSCTMCTDTFVNSTRSSTRRTREHHTSRTIN